MKVFGQILRIRSCDPRLNESSIIDLQSPWDSAIEIVLENVRFPLVHKAYRENPQVRVFLLNVLALEEYCQVLEGSPHVHNI